MHRFASLPALLAGAAVSLATPLASGRIEVESGYSKSQTYNAALRYLRVDLGYVVTERDPDAAYLLFRYILPGRKAETYGSIEIVEARQTVKVIVQLPQLPSYHEQVLSDGLRRKLHDEYGDPAPTPAPNPEPERKPPPEQPRKAPEGADRKPEKR